MPIKLDLSAEQKAYWVEQSQHSNSLYNCAIYEFRQHYFKQPLDLEKFNFYWVGDELCRAKQLKQIRGINYEEVEKRLKGHPHYKALPAQTAQQTIKVAASTITSYNGLVGAYFKGNVKHRPRLPKFRKSGGLFNLIFTDQQITFVEGRVSLAVANSAKNEMICDTWIDVPEFVIPEQVKQIRIRPSRGEFFVDFIIDDGKAEPEINPQLDYGHALSIDHGVKFWLSAVSSYGKSFIVEAPQLKTSIWQYQTKVKQYKKGKSNFYWDEYLDRLTLKHNLRVRDCVNKAARFIINHCLKNQIGNLVIGWNEGNKPAY